jgi:hypothetical protein
MSELSIFKVTGYKPVVGNKVEYMRASSEARVLQHIKSIGPDVGGFVTYSVEEIEVLPVDVNIDCPSCGANFPSPDRVATLS